MESTIDRTNNSSLPLESNVVDILRKTLGAPPNSTDAKISLHEPLFRGHEWEYVKECLDTGWVSSVGKYVDRFEQMLSEICEMPFVVAAVNGTAALQVACRLVGVQTGDEVLVPALTFIATTNAISHSGAIPHFVEAEPERLGVDPVRLRIYLKEISERKGNELRNKKTGRPIRALVVMHAFGHPARIDELLEVANEFGLPLIEDAAEAIGSRLEGRHLGHHGVISTLSFNGNKIITTGGGGALLFHDEKLAKRAKHLTTTAKQPHAWEFFHDEVGYNFRLPNLNSALGCAQLEQLPSYLQAKRRLAKTYRDHFAAQSHVRFLDEPLRAESNFWLNAIVLQKPDRELRNRILKATNDAGFMTRPLWTLMHRLPMYSECPRMDLSVSEALESSVINLPSSVKLGEMLL